jgi:glycosyltransferase involved in cell wall biosynthesis
MPTVTIVTPAYRPDREHLLAAYASILRQEMPAGWHWQWVVQVDGGTADAVAGILPADPRVSVGGGRRSGECSTRNLCLARAEGELIKVLDADDMLPPGTLARDISVLADNPDVGWTTSRVLDLLPDGSTVGFDQDPPPGRLERGTVLAHWRAHNYRASVHPATLCIRRDLVMALGGWMALPGSGDTGLLLAANAITPGWFNAETGLLYRKHPAQMTSQPGHTDPAEWSARMRIIGERADALASLAAVAQPVA